MKKSLLLTAAFAAGSLAAMAQNSAFLTANNGGPVTYETAKLSAINLDGGKVTILPSEGDSIVFDNNLTGLKFFKNMAVTPGDAFMADENGGFARYSAINAAAKKGWITYTGQSKMNSSYHKDDMGDVKGGIEIPVAESVTISCPSIATFKADLYRTGTFMGNVKISFDGVHFETVATLSGSKGLRQFDFSEQLATNRPAFVQIENTSSGKLYLMGVEIIQSANGMTSEVPTIFKTADPTDPDTPEEGPQDPPATSDYVLMTSMVPADSIVGAEWKDVDNYMRNLMYEYSEHPNSEAADHTAGKHIEVLYDETLKMNVFKFMIHKNDSIIDGDRGSLQDRQRNEMKSRTAGNRLSEVNGNHNDWQKLEWKFKIPKGYQPSASFTHIHQLKGISGSDISSPLITITLRSDSDGSKRRVEVIHTARSGGSSKGRIVENVDIADFEDEWVQVETEQHCCRHGYYHIKITRISDGKVLIDHVEKDIDLWRAKGATVIRSKYGIYRSVGGSKDSSGNWLPETFGSNNLLKDEHIYLTDFKIYESKNNTAGGAVDD